MPDQVRHDVRILDSQDTKNSLHYLIIPSDRQRHPPKRVKNGGLKKNNNLKRFSDRMKSAGKTRRIRSHVVYGGDESQQRSDAQVLSWRHTRRVVVDESPGKME